MHQRVLRALLGRKPRDCQPPVDEHRRLHEIHFPRNLTAVIRRERARADRQKSQFSLVMFRQVPATGRFATLRLCRLVLNQVRVADEVGQFDRNTVCAILPDTGPDGAWKLIQRVHDCASPKQGTIEPVVYTYPTSWLDEPGGDGPAGGLSAERPAPMRIAPETTAETQAIRANSLPLRRLLIQKPSLAKRAIDVCVATTMLTLAAPLMVLFAAVIKFTSEGPVVFKQWRSGLGGRPFEIYKFRTMCANADAMKAALRAHSEQDGPAFKMTRDPRITAVGHFLRKTSLDELPQLFNVLKGDMSLVGPRPLPLDEQAQCDQWHKGRLDVMPGLTCIWQVHGRSRVSFEDWMRMDLKYVRRSEVLHDIKLMLQTIPAVLLRRGAK
ncbi:MAG TPA: sugar transferase [Tepidisphaeraceae bacterium]|jgi:lipopolysaccharide/colanic/teichoic acid biosynthesis glycosyltransferase